MSFSAGKMAQLPCFQHVRWQPDRQELRRFACSMLIGFSLLGLMAAWRNQAFGWPTWMLWSLGIALAGGGLVPGFGRLVYLGIYLPTSLLGYVMSHVLLTLLFFLAFTPLGILLKCLGKDLLCLQRPRHRTLWIAHSNPTSDERYYRQF